MIGVSIRNIIIGKDNFIPSRNDYKHVLLSGILILIAIPAIVPFAIIDFAFGYQDTLRIYLASIECLLLALLLHRLGYHIVAKNLLLVTLNFTIYLFASSDPVGTSTRALFTIVILAAFAIFTHDEKKWTVIQVIIVILMYLTSYFQKLPLLNYRPYSDNIILINDLTTIAISLIGGSVILIVLKNLNYYHAQQLENINEQLLKANSELDRFVYSTSHDLRAPLTSIMGLIHLTSLTQDPKEINYYLNLMRNRITTLDKFIHDITCYSRNNRQDVVPEKIQLAEFIADIWQDLKHADDAKDITLNIDIDNQDIIVADPNRLRMVFSNLLSNAIRYHDVRKEQKTISVELISNENAYYLKVKDNGLGIASEHQAKIFDMFYRAHERSNGSGLGLYIVKGAVHKMSGHIHLESMLGVGSCFTIRIPKTDFASA